MMEGLVFRDGVRTDERVAIDGVPSLAEAARGVRLDRRRGPDGGHLGALAGEFRLHPLVVEDARAPASAAEGGAVQRLRVRRAASGRRRRRRSQRDGRPGREPRCTRSPVTGSWSPSVLDPRFDMDRDGASMGGPAGAAGAGRRVPVYVLFDEVVDGYLSAVERFEEMVDDLEDDIFAKEDGQGESPEIRERLFHLKRETVRLRRFVLPLREGIEFLLGPPGARRRRARPLLPRRGRPRDPDRRAARQRPGPADLDAGAAGGAGGEPGQRGDEEPHGVGDDPAGAHACSPASGA